MFKKIASIALAAMMVSATAVVANAAEADEAVAAADDSVVAAADESAVAAADDGSTVAAAEDGSSVGAGNKVYFKVDRNVWKNFKEITCYIGPHNGGDAPFVWGAKKGLCEEEGDDLYSYDFDAKGITIESGKQYSLNFTGDWGVQTCDMLFDSSIMGKTCTLTSEQVENNVDSNKKSYVCTWEGQDSSKYGPVKLITSIGNVIGTAYWADTTPYDMLLNFIKSDGKDGLKNALNFNGKTAQQTLDDTAKALGLNADDIEKAIKESGKTDIEWSKDKSSVNSGSGSSSSSSGSSSSSSSSSSSGSGSSSSSSGSSSSSSSGTGSVKSGEGETLVFLFGGIMLAAAGVIFLARKKREE